MAKMQYGNVMLEELPLEIRKCANIMILKGVDNDRYYAIGCTGRYYVRPYGDYLRVYPQMTTSSATSTSQDTVVSWYNSTTDTWGACNQGRWSHDTKEIVWSNNGYTDNYSYPGTYAQNADITPARGMDLVAYQKDFSSESSITFTRSDTEDKYFIVVCRSALTVTTDPGITCEVLYSDTPAGDREWTYIVRTSGGTGSFRMSTARVGRFRFIRLSGPDAAKFDWANIVKRPDIVGAGGTITKPENQPTGAWIFTNYSAIVTASTSGSYMYQSYIAGLDSPLRMAPCGQCGHSRVVFEVDLDEEVMSRSYRANHDLDDTSITANVYFVPFRTAVMHGDAEYTHNLDAVDEVQSNRISWHADTPEGSTAKVSVALGSGAYAEVQNGGAIPGITVGQALAATTLKIKVELARESADIVPSVSNLQVDVHGTKSATQEVVTIPRMAMIVVSSQARCGAQVSGWIPEQIYYLATRAKDPDTGVLTLHGYDAMMRGEQTYADFTGFTTWPQTDSAVVEEIMGLLGLTWDSRNAELQDYNVEYPNDLTMREVLGYIAASYCCNLTMAMELVEGTWLNTIRMVPLTGTDDEVEVGSSYTELTADAPLDPYSKVTVWYDDTNAFEAGDDTGRRLEVDQLYAKQPMANAMLARVEGFEYQPFDAKGAIVHPLAELGDLITIGDITSIICYMKREYDLCGFADVSAPVDDEVDYEYKFVSPSDRKLARKVSLGESYFGTSITREHGLKVEKIDGNDRVIGEAIFNSDVLAMRAMIDGQMKDCIYFDTINGKYKISGDVDVEGAIESEAVITDAIYAEQGDIAQLTVDVLNTSRRIAKYLNEDLTDDNHFEASGNTIAFVTSSVKTGDGDAPLDEQLTNRYGDLVFWKEEISDADIQDGYPYINGHRVYTTTDDTGFPVMVYQYNNYTKRKIEFQYDTAQGAYIPVDTFGVGDEHGNSVGTIRKDTNGFSMEYVNYSGAVKGVHIGDFVDADMRRLSSCQIGNNVITYTVEGDNTDYQISYVDNGSSVTFTWPDGHTCEVSFV